MTTFISVSRNRYYIAGKEITHLLKSNYDTKFKADNKIIHSLLPELIGQHGSGEIAFANESDMNLFIENHIKTPLNLSIWDTEQ